jgi:bifunctional UDP-N-acetylglucosamine pyrophosphorylase / glucosamine-1-phosphate N-acetyltransferase
MAAGAGTRMRSRRPKVLARVLGRTMLDAVLDQAERLSPAEIVVVLGSGKDEVEAHLRETGRAVRIALQDPPRGTGDAVARALAALSRPAGGPVLVVSGDVPLVRAETLSALLELFQAHRADLAFLTFFPPEPGALGRVRRDARKRPVAIVETRHGGGAAARIRECNAGIYVFDRRELEETIGGLPVHAESAEIYLTDIVAVLARRKKRIEALEAPDWTEAMGVNTAEELAAAARHESRRGAARLSEQGCSVLAPDQVWIGPYVRASADAVIHPFSVILGKTTIGEGTEIRPFCEILDSKIGQGARVGPHAVLEGAEVGDRSTVGPFARLRPGSVLGPDVRVGNFVETKNAKLARGVKASHLSYLGDTEIGADANIGAGVITCNYDGERKHKTTIGERAFIGSDTQLVAPVTVGAGAYVGAGSTVTEDVPAGALAVSRSPQRNIEDWAEKKRSRAEERRSKVREK